MRLPTVRILRTRYPDLAGVLLRDWQRQECLVVYRYYPAGPVPDWYGAGGFHLVAVRPHWRWVIRLVFGFWLGQWGRPVSYERVVWRRRGG